MSLKRFHEHIARMSVISIIDLQFWGYSVLLGVCNFARMTYMVFSYGFNNISAEIKFRFIHILTLLRLISLKDGPVGNRHVMITLREIFMLHIHIMIHVIRLYQYMWPLLAELRINVAKAALILYWYNWWTELFQDTFRKWQKGWDLTTVMHNI